MGVFHVELRSMASVPRVIEVNGRLMGDLIPLLLERATGPNIPQALVSLAAGETPGLKSVAQGSELGISFVWLGSYVLSGCGWRRSRGCG